MSRTVVVREKAVAELLIAAIKGELPAGSVTCMLHESSIYDPTREQQVTRKRWVFTIEEAT